MEKANKMKTIKTKINGPLIIKKETFNDTRGYLRELYKEKQPKYIKDESTEMPKNNYELRSQIAELLKAKVASCNKENFMELKERLEFNYNHLVRTDWMEREMIDLVNPWDMY